MRGEGRGVRDGQADSLEAGFAEDGVAGSLVETDANAALNDFNHAVALAKRHFQNERG